MRTLASIDELDYSDYLQPGDRLVWGQACGVPRTLVEHLTRSPVPSDLSAFIGIDLADMLSLEDAARMRLTSYIGSGGNSRLHAAGLLAITPVHYSTLPDLIEVGGIGVDAVLLQVPPPDGSGRFSLGTNRDYLVDAIRRARVIIVEIDERVPFTDDGPLLTASDIAVAVPSTYPPATLAARMPTAAEEQIATYVAALVEDGATLQLGVGSLAAAVLDKLGHHRHLGVHSGQISDGVVDLMLSGVITGARKTRDRGVAVGGMLIGTQRLFDFARGNPGVSLRPARYTHALSVLAELPQFTAINSALEVDLTGQVNAEVIRGRYVGGVGGSVDFLRGAAASPGGQPIVMTTSTAGGASSIVAQLSGPVTTGRSDVGIVVTEHGYADLRGSTLDQRVEAMIGLAAPQYRPELIAAAGQVPAGPERQHGS